MVIPAWLLYRSAWGEVCHQCDRCVVLGCSSGPVVVVVVFGVLLLFLHPVVGYDLRGVIGVGCVAVV